MVDICIDAGHGGTDPGATYGKVYEKDITLSISKKLNALLKARGFTTVLTRNSDATVLLADRVNISNKAGAKLFVSIHVNSNSGTAGTGIETLIYSTGGNAEKCAKKVQAQLISATGAKNRGLKLRPELYVLKKTTAPALLVETGFINNSNDRAKLITADYQNKIAEAIARGICEHFGKVYKVNNFTDIKGHYAEKEINEIAELGIVVGVGNNKFDPNGTLTRGQACIIISRLIKYIKSLLK